MCVLERGTKTGLWGDRSYKTKEKLCLCLFLEVRKKSKVMKRGIQEKLFEKMMLRHYILKKWNRDLTFVYFSVSPNPTILHLELDIPFQFIAMALVASVSEFKFHVQFAWLLLPSDFFKLKFVRDKVGAVLKLLEKNIYIYIFIYLFFCCFWSSSIVLF